MTISKKAILVDNPDLAECVRFKLRDAETGLLIDGDLSNVVSVSPWRIDFGDGTRLTLPTDETQMPSHTYAAAGDYDIVLGGRLTGVSAKHSRMAPLLGSARQTPCPALREVVFADDAPTAVIDAATFRNCATIERLVLPPKLVMLGIYSFTLCSSLTELELPATLTTIGGRSFYGCTSLTKIVNHAVEPQVLDAYEFHNVPRTIPLYVPAESVEAYKEAEIWKEFEIVPI